MHCVCALKAIDYIVEYNSKPDSMMARHERTTTSVHFTGMCEFLANGQSTDRTVIGSLQVNTTVLVSALYKCIIHVRIEFRALATLCVCVKLASHPTNLLSESPRIRMQMSNLN